MIPVFLHCGLFIISNMEFLFSWVTWVTNLYICIAQLENILIKSSNAESNKSFHLEKKMIQRKVSVAENAKSLKILLKKVLTQSLIVLWKEWWGMTWQCAAMYKR